MQPELSAHLYLIRKNKFLNSPKTGFIPEAFSIALKDSEFASQYLEPIARRMRMKLLIKPTTESQKSI